MTAVIIILAIVVAAALTFMAMRVRRLDLEIKALMQPADAPWGDPPAVPVPYDAVDHIIAEDSAWDDGQ